MHSYPGNPGDLTPLLFHQQAEINHSVFVHMRDSDKEVAFCGTQDSSLYYAFLFSVSVILMLVFQLQNV